MEHGWATRYQLTCMYVLCMWAQSLLVASGRDHECEDYFMEVVGAVERVPMLVFVSGKKYNVPGGMMLHGALNLSPDTSGAAVVNDNGDLLLRKAITMCFRNGHYVTFFPVGDDQSGDVTILVDEDSLGRFDNAIGWVVPNEWAVSPEYSPITAMQVADIMLRRKLEGQDDNDTEQCMLPTCCFGT
jgi:hypothetical protein